VFGVLPSEPKIPKLPSCWLLRTVSPRTIVSPLKYKSFHLFVSLPKSYVISVFGIKSDSKKAKSELLSLSPIFDSLVETLDSISSIADCTSCAANSEVSLSYSIFEAIIFKAVP
jgi:hypothetical protein